MNPIAPIRQLVPPAISLSGVLIAFVAPALARR